jgi:hypothetical protein
MLVPTGISLKPSDSQLKEFVKKIKTLDKDFIFNKLCEKLSLYESGTQDQHVFKMINVSLFYFISTII